MLERLVALLAEARRVFLVAHREPDGDALGATLGLLHLLADNGKDALAHSAGPVPEEYAFLPGLERLGPAAPEGVDLAVILDCHEPERCGEAVAPFLRALPRVAVIDHHQGRAEFGAAIWVDPSYAATCQMVFDLAGRLGWSVGPRAATCLFVGLQTDTGSFRYGNTTPQALRAAADLVQAGADPWAISQEVYATRPLRLRLLGRVMEAMELFADGRLALAVVSQADLDALGAKPQDLEQAVEAMRGVPGVAVAALIKQTGPDQCKLSLRSRGGLDVAAVAAGLGGGGHRNAAGARLAMDLASARTLVAELLEPLAAAL